MLAKAAVIYIPSVTSAHAGLMAPSPKPAALFRFVGLLVKYASERKIRSCVVLRENSVKVTVIWRS